MKSMAWGITSCSFMASWPAPLGMRNTGRPRACTAASHRACQAGWLGAAGTAKVRSIWNDRPRRVQIRSISASTSAARASRAALVVARRSRLKRQRPGTTLMEPAGTSSWPTVPTTSGTEAARRSTYRMTSAAAAAASRRRFMGVVPAWLAMPWISTRQRTLPLMEVTTPSGRSISLSTGPCSMCTSTKPR